MDDQSRLARTGIGAVACFLGVALAVALGFTAPGIVLALAGVALLLTAVLDREPVLARRRD